MNINVSFFRQDVPRFKFTKEAMGELSLAKISLTGESKNRRIDSTLANFGVNQFSTLHDELQRIRNIIDNETHVLLVDGFDADTVGDFKAMVWTFGSLLGAPMIQNQLNHKIIEVYDRGGKSIEEGAHYHQTRQGAYVHNDGVSDPLPIDYLILACGQKAYIGGESILIDASAVYAELVGFPDILNILQGDVLFENRGMADEELLFKAPIFRFSDKGVPLIRYFRVYIESAHNKAGQPLTPKQIEALDFLDTVLEQSNVQSRVLLEPGQILISADDKFLHTRTQFIDGNIPTAEVKGSELLKNMHRYMVRVWLRKF